MGAMITRYAWLSVLCSYLQESCSAEKNSNKTRQSLFKVHQIIPDQDLPLPFGWRIAGRWISC